MKIAFLNKYQDKVNRGAETYVFELSKRLSKNHEVDVLSDINYIKLLFSNYDVIIPTNGRLQVVLARLITWLKGSKMLVSGQSGIGLDDRINLYSFPNYFVALSTHALNWAKSINPLVKSVYIPNGVDIEKFKRSDSNKKDSETVLSVGAFTNEKRHDLTIKAVSKLKKVKLIIVGGGGEKKEEIEKMGKRLLGNRFNVLSVKHSKMPDIYKKVDVLAFPTVPWESFGIVLTEAMASNLPVVATSDPIRKEIVGEAGILVDPENTEEYAKALEFALKEKWGNKPRKQAEKFNWENIALEYEELLNTLK